ncbi:hypothetical protein [Zooshikella harenae]|uniref:Uncharacterized protein n=1 Tax=Zooshikella harenae TaxID=2827238 RepID=A0ABS5ZK50_9GAMM|nr:hypothetical protein [Zooshikella harenae]MBU2714457.1 hypothetical protein [Zooshikella harenae]
MELEKLYTSRRLLKKAIRKQESRLAFKLSNIDHYSKANPKNINSIENALEWFLTWRLKLSDYSEIMWCDGVEKLELEKLAPKKWKFSAVAWIGPESNIDIINKCNVLGSLLLNRNGTGIKSYFIDIDDNGKKYTAKK